jgi:Protein of unknown function (DUF4058)
MNSPFPGMDPYLEQFWGDIHSRLVLYACDQLEDQLPGKLIARVEERLVVEGVDEDNRNIFPDVRISEQSALTADGGVAVMEGTTATEPIIVRYTSEPATETFINLFEPGTRNRLITVIEILSPSNKVPGEGQLKYKKKQAELKKAKVSLVEIDLLRAGNRVFSIPVSRIPRKFRTLYQACVRRGWQVEEFEIYPIPLQARLPSLRIPLRKKDQDIRLDLQAIFALAYRKGRYFSSINYEEPPEPSLKGVDATWTDELLRKAGKR